MKKSVWMKRLEWSEYILGAFVMAFSISAFPNYLLMMQMILLGGAFYLGLPSALVRKIQKMQV